MPNDDAELIELSPGRFAWVLSIPWLPDLLTAARETTITGGPLLEAFGRQIAFLRAFAASASPESALQLRFIAGSSPEGFVECYLVGRAASPEDAAVLASLTRHAMPSELPLAAVDRSATMNVLKPIDTSSFLSNSVCEVRRALEIIDPTIDPSAATGDEYVVTPWIWSPQALVNTLGLLRKQAGICVLTIHIQRARPSDALRSYLQDQVLSLNDLARGDPTNPLVSVIRGGYLRWMRHLGRSALHLRVLLASTEALMPGLAPFIGADLTRSWEAEGGPGALVGNFEVTYPREDFELDCCAALLDDLDAHPWGVGELDPELAELLFLFDPHEANTAFRIPVTPRGGLEGVATGRLQSLGRGAQRRAQQIGSVLVGRSPSGEAFHLSHDDLTRHVLVAGVPGSGKTTTVQTLILQLAQSPQPVPFLILDPAKADYGSIGSVVPNFEHIRLDPAQPAFNPFAVPAGVPAGAHAERVLAAFDSAFQLSVVYPLAFVLMGKAIFRAYEESGSDGDWPTLRDVYRCAAAEIEEGTFGSEARGQLKGSLLGRLEFLANGPLGRTLLATAAIDWDHLMTTPTLIELRDFPGPSERALVFGLLLSGLVSYRENHGEGTLVHVTVLEEAHRLLGGRAMGTAGVELFADAIAELRSAGEGFIVVDQAPSMLHPAVSKQTGTKIAHRLLDSEERQFMADAMVFEGSQHQDLARLRPGRAIVFSPSSSVPTIVDVETADLGGLPPVPRWGTLVRDNEWEAVWCVGCPNPCVGRRGAEWARALAPPIADQLRTASQGTAAAQQEAVTRLVGGVRKLSEQEPASTSLSYCVGAGVLGYACRADPTRLAAMLRIYGRTHWAASRDSSP